MKKIVLTLVAVVIVAIVGAVVIVSLSLNGIIKKGVEAYGPQILKVSIKLNSVSCSPFSGSGEIRGLVIGNPEGFKTPQAIKAERIQLSIVPSSAFSKPIHIRQLVVEAPDITMEGDVNSSNLTKIQENVEAAVPSDPNNPTRLIIDDLKITGGKIHLSMTLLGGKAMTVPLPDISRKDIGKDTGGVTVKELSLLIAGDMMGQVAGAATKAIGDLGKGLTDETGKAVEGAGSAVEKAGEALKGIFK
jgi:hypothetical protein